MDAAIAHIRRYGSDHTEIIVTNDYANSQAWLRRVNSSTVGINCSTAFADGFRLGLGNTGFAQGGWAQTLSLAW